MRTIISEKRLRAMLEKMMLLNESQQTGASGLITGTTNGVVGVTVNQNGYEINDPDLSNKLLTMLSRSDWQQMGNVYEDVAQFLTLPMVHGKNSTGGTAAGYVNLNDTLGMAISPAADIGKDFASGYEREEEDNITYKIKGECWSVKSSGGAAGGGFTTTPTAIGQLAACGLLAAGSEIEDFAVNDQAAAYSALVKLLNIGDKVKFNMGLSYYTYNRETSPVTLRMPVDRNGKEIAYLALNSTTSGNTPKF